MFDGSLYGGMGHMVQFLFCVSTFFDICILFFRCRLICLLNLKLKTKMKKLFFKTLPLRKKIQLGEILQQKKSFIILIYLTNEHNNKNKSEHTHTPKIDSTFT
jgi:hypothetical protein